MVQAASAHSDIVSLDWQKLMPIWAAQTADRSCKHPSGAALCVACRCRTILAQTRNKDRNSMKRVVEK